MAEQTPVPSTIRGHGPKWIGLSTPQHFCRLGKFLRSPMTLQRLHVLWLLRNLYSSTASSGFEVHQARLMIRLINEVVEEVCAALPQHLRLQKIICCVIFSVHHPSCRGVAGGRRSAVALWNSSPGQVSGCGEESTLSHKHQDPKCGVEVDWVLWPRLFPKRQLAVPVQAAHWKTDSRPPVEDCARCNNRYGPSHNYLFSVRACLNPAASTTQTAKQKLLLFSAVCVCVFVCVCVCVCGWVGVCVCVCVCCVCMRDVKQWYVM